MTDTAPFRCSVASEAGALGAEPLAGTAPTDTEWLLVEVPGPWGRKAVGESRLPDDVVTRLEAFPGRVQLVRRPDGGVTDGGRVVVRASLSAEPTVRSVLIDDLRAVVELADADLEPHPGPLWLVCTNGRRDVCCAERGRPVVAALADVDPAATWETSHLGGHRFAATMLHLPSGMALGRLDPASAPAAVATLGAGHVPLAAVRGRAGWSPSAQAADLHLRAGHGWTGLTDVALVEEAGGRVVLDTPDGVAVVHVDDAPGPPRRQSCADLSVKGTRILTVVGVTMGG